MPVDRVNCKKINVRKTIRKLCAYFSLIAAKVKYFIVIEMPRDTLNLNNILKLGSYTMREGCMNTLIYIIFSLFFRH